MVQLKFLIDLKKIDTKCLKFKTFALQYLVMEEYAAQWGLTVNLAKSKVKVFRRGGRLGAGDSFRYNKEKIEVVSSYMYLGVTMTPQAFILQALC